MNDNPGVDLLGELWNKFHEKKSLLIKLVEKEQEVGVSMPGETPGYFTYFAGAEVKDRTEISEDFLTWNMPAGDYIICAFEAEDFYQLATNALNKARDYLFGVWLPAHNLISEAFMAEVYYNVSPEASYMEIWTKIKE